MQIGTNYGTSNAYADMNLINRSSKQYVEKGVEKPADIKTEQQIDYNEKAFESLAPNAPEEVKNAWLDASKEVGVNGMGMLQNGMLSHISSMAAQKVVKWYNGEQNYSDILGNSVESAIQKTKEALYDLENPLSPNYNRPIEVQHQLMKEKEFYESFLEKLQNIANQ